MIDIRAAPFCAKGDGVSDDWPAFKAAATAAVTYKQSLYLAGGGYNLLSQDSSLDATGLMIRGDGTGSVFAPYTGSGSVVMLSHPTLPLFTGMAGTLFRDVAFTWPAQLPTLATPIPYPALFEITTGSQANNDFDNIRLVNAYTFVHTSGAGGIGRTSVRGSRLYAIDKLVHMQNGIADILVFEDCQIGPSAMGTSGGTLGVYTLASGEVFRVDVGGAAYPRVDGLQLRNCYVLGYQRAMRVVSGQVDISTLNGSSFDSVGTVLQVDAAGSMVSTQWSGGMVYSANTNDMSQCAPVILLSGTALHTTDLSIGAVNFAFALGSILEDTTGCLRRLTISGCPMTYFGRSLTPGTYYAVKQDGGGGAIITVSGCQLDPSGGTNITSGMLITQSSGLAVISGNAFNACANSVVVQGNGGTTLLSANGAVNSTGPCVVNALTGTGKLVNSADNSWDK